MYSFNEFDQFAMQNMEDISTWFKAPHEYFAAGLGPCYIYKFDPNIVVKIYMKDKKEEYEVLVYKKKVEIHHYFIPYSNMYKFINESLNKTIEKLIRESCLSEYEDGFNT